ncbi:MAG TPA: SDR family NAD(P)-dependent oxidoreductase [Polyangiales bacterium]|jgi:NAD(P)-dependent dehydrogenase (short-subunit alcohol dehydrogenase family)|nr:SDR family NAD(P)-dependent oxidoreductase [Polyangiales bacterium]
MSKPPKNALIVGVGPGLGGAAAKRLAADGYRVAVAARDVDKLSDIATETDGLAVAMDATDPSSIEAGIARVEEEFGEIHTVVWNVGGGGFGDLEKVGIEALELSFDTNTRGLFVLAKQLVPAMAARGDGALIITGATASLRGKPFTTAFAAGKAAQRSLAQSLARQYGKQGVHVALIIIDGMVDLPSTRERMRDTPQEAFVSPEGFADAVSFLLHQRRGAWTFELDIRPHVENW